jgi:hypothetical protein
MGCVNVLLESTEPMIGLFHNYLAASLVSDVDPEFMVRAWKWYQKVIATDNRLGGGSFVLLEIMQEVNHYP